MIANMNAKEETHKTMYDLIGGDQRVRELVDRFYDLMDLETDFATLRAMHPPSLEGSRDKLYHFLSGWTGGPDLYTPRYGNAFLRARHLPFSIGTSARDQWLLCMVLAMLALALFNRLMLNRDDWRPGVLRISILCESLFGIAALMAVSLLGTLPPMHVS